MKIEVLISCLGTLLVCMAWMGSTPTDQSSNQSVDLDLIALSERLLYQVKTDESTDSIIFILSHYSAKKLEEGLTNDAARKTFWINLYNAWYQILAIRDNKLKDVIYSEKNISFADVSFSLDDIEHGILRRYRWKYSLGYLPQFIPSRIIKKLAVNEIDFRLHFALNCGAKSCPPIAFYQYNSINTQLDVAAKSFLRSETTIDSVKKVVHVTKIMQWFKGDFGGDRGIKLIISKYLETDVLSYKIKFNEYDWSDDLRNYK